MTLFSFLFLQFFFFCTYPIFLDQLLFKVWTVHPPAGWQVYGFLLLFSMVCTLVLLGKLCGSMAALLGLMDEAPVWRLQLIVSLFFNMVITCISHNVKGFNSPIKRRKAFAFYKHLQAKILFIQETHFSQVSHPKFFHRHFPQAFYTLHSSKSTGAAIFLHFSFPMQVYKDKESRFIIIKGIVLNRELTIASIYAPNDVPNSFFKSLFERLSKFQSTHMINGGDFNMVANASLDRSTVATSARASPKSFILGAAKL